MKQVKRQGWGFTLFLGVTYLLVFHFWIGASRNWVILSCLVATVVLSLLFLLAQVRGYFRNRWDALLHFFVMVDILLEGLLIPVHEGRGYILCALGFAVVIGGYRKYLRRRQARIPR
jgi:hypothetical protein